MVKRVMCRFVRCPSSWRFVQMWTIDHTDRIRTVMIPTM